MSRRRAVRKLTIVQEDSPCGVAHFFTTEQEQSDFAWERGNGYDFSELSSEQAEPSLGNNNDESERDAPTPFEIMLAQVILRRDSRNRRPHIIPLGCGQRERLVTDTCPHCQCILSGGACPNCGHEIHLPAGSMKEAGRQPTMLAPRCDDPSDHRPHPVHYVRSR